MNGVVKELKEGGVLFDDIVFEKTCIQKGSLDIKNYSKHFEVHFDQNGLPIHLPIFLNESETLYVPISWRTSDYRIKRINKVADYVNLHQFKDEIKESLLDESMPDEFESSPFLEFEGGLLGRSWFVQLVDEQKFEPAFDELREIVLHDKNAYMKYLAIYAVSELKGEKVAKVLCEKMLDYKEDMFLREEAAMKLFWHPYESNVKPLREIYESSQNAELHYIGLKDIDKIHSLSALKRMPGICLTGLGKISSLESLEGIKAGFDNSQENVQNIAGKALDSWIDMNADNILKGTFQGNVEKRIHLIQNLIFKYDRYNKKIFYEDKG